MVGIPPMSELACIFFDKIDWIHMLLNLEFLNMLGCCTICDDPLVFRRIYGFAIENSCRKVVLVSNRYNIISVARRLHLSCV